MVIECQYCGKKVKNVIIGISTNGAFLRIDENGKRFVGNNCRPCRLKRRATYLKKVGNAPCKKYEKTKNGFLMRCYRNMQSRVEGVQKKKHHLYRGLSLLRREEFYSWAKNDDKFHVLFSKWESQGYPRKLTPSVDRINSKKGYQLPNMEWVTHSENSRRGTVSRFGKSK